MPANRIGCTMFSVSQPNVLQEAIWLTVFVPFAVFCPREPLKLDLVWAGLCVLLGTVYFMFRARPARRADPAARLGGCLR